MEFNVVLSDFQRVLQKVLPAVPPKATVPVLEHLYFKLNDSKLQIIATDQNITIVSNLTVISESNGSILIPARMLNDIVKALGNAGSIKIVANLETYDINIFSFKGTYEMKGLDPEDYIDIPQLFESKNPEFENTEGLASSTNNAAFFTKEQLIRMADKTLFCVSNDEYRISMTGVLFQFRETFASAVATDSFRLSRVTVTSESSSFPQDFDLLLPSKSVELLRKVDDDVYMTTIESYGKITHARFDYGETTFITRTIGEKFPPYESVLPKSNDIVLYADLEEFKSSLRRVSLFANEKSRQIKMTISDNSIKLYAEDDETGKHGEETLACEFNSNHYEVAFNSKFLMEAVEHIDPKETENNMFMMTFSEPNRPVLVVPKSVNQDLLLLVMPVRVNG